MQDLSLNFPTVAIVLVIVTLAVLAIRRMVRRGLCDCGDHCGEGEGRSGCGHCQGCPSCGSCWAARKVPEAGKSQGRPSMRP